MKVGLVGASGKMGTEIIKLAEKDPSLFIIACRSRGDSELIALSDVIVDFSAPERMKELLEKLIQNPKPLVSGTTGHKNFELIEVLSKKVPVLWSANMSLGVNLIICFLQKYAKLLREFDISILELHHKNKKDSPSGTAVSMKNTINEQLPEKSIDILSLRASEIFGQHTLTCIDKDEIIKLEHVALNRSLFAKGAILAAKAIVKMPIGMYSMQHLLNL